MTMRLRWTLEVFLIVAFWGIVVGAVVLGLRTRPVVSTLPELEDIRNYESPPTPPPTQFLLLDGRNLLLNSLRGKVVILNFWYLDCAPCITEMEELKSLYENLKPRGLELIAINIQDSKERLEEFVRAKKIPFLIALDPGRKLANAYNVHFFPTTLFLNRRGKIVGSTLGAKTWSSKKYRDYVSALLAIE